MPQSHIQPSSLLLSPDRSRRRLTFSPHGSPRVTGFVSSFSTRAHRSCSSTSPLGFHWMGGLVRRLGVGGVLCVPREGLSGDLCILRKTGLQVLLLSSSSGHIDAWVTFPSSFVTRITSGPRLRSVCQIEDFQWVIDDCNVLSFDFVGYPFTWTNNRKDDNNVQVQLDRGFGNLALV
ncbi:hypothetical protein PRUPE_8G101400 [Prunus persica]|uniref:Uncharacterized protein n=1 Tax=Prunus persica TaxID=3760 RepID=M5VMK9_PRUPE|nr:hypothetical protein PRUPE_8G101400 [Prunus persica]